MNDASRIRRARVWALWALVACMEWLCRPLSFKASRGLGQGLGWLAGVAGWFFWKPARRQIDVCYGASLPLRRKWSIGLGMFAQLGQGVFELLWMKSALPDQLGPRLRIEGLANFERARQRGRGIVIVTGHLGNWEWLAAWVAAQIPLVVLARSLPNWLLDRWLVSLRNRFGVRSIDRGDLAAAREALRALRRGEAVGVLIDQDTRVEGDFVPFFGRPAWTPTGAAALALRTGAALLPTFIAREPDGHRILFEAPVWIEEKGEKKELLRRYTAWLTERIEFHVRLHPDQWVWIHRRFKTRPQEAPVLPISASPELAPASSGDS